MAKPTGALLSFGASGSLAKTMVFASWRGRQYVRRHVVPANPRSTAQTLTRNVFSWASAQWRSAPSLVQQTYLLAAKGRPITDRNVFVQAQISNLRSQTDLNFMNMFQPAGGGAALDNLTATPGASSLTLSATPPTPPAGWTLTSVMFGVIKDQDPGVVGATPTFFIAAAEDTTSPYSVTITGLVSGQIYQARAACKWLKPDGTEAFGAEKGAQATPA